MFCAKCTCWLMVVPWKEHLEHLWILASQSPCFQILEQSLSSGALTLSLWWHWTDCNRDFCQISYIWNPGCLSSYAAPQYWVFEKQCFPRSNAAQHYPRCYGIWFNNQCFDILCIHEAVSLPFFEVNNLVKCQDQNSGGIEWFHQKSLLKAIIHGYQGFELKDLCLPCQASISDVVIQSSSMSEFSSKLWIFQEGCNQAKLSQVTSQILNVRLVD